MSNPVLTISPMPPTQGEDVTITLTGGDPNALIVVSWDPGGERQYALKDGSTTIRVPKTATSMIVSGGGATPISSSITPR